VRARVRVMVIYEFLLRSQNCEIRHAYIYISKLNWKLRDIRPDFLSTNSGNYSMFTGQVMKALTLFKQSGLQDKYEH